MPMRFWLSVRREGFLACLLFFAFLFPMVTISLAAEESEDTTRDLNRILSKPEYQRWKTTMMDQSGPETMESGSEWKVPRWLENLGTRIWEWLTGEGKDKPERRRSSSLPHGSPLTIGFFSVVGYLLLAAAILFFLFAAVMYLRNRERLPPIPKAGPRVGIAKALEEGDALAYDQAEWHREADRFKNGGDLRLAFRSLYLGLLSGLHEQGKIVFARNRTNWHYVRGFRGQADARGRFSEMTDLFDRVWYGLVPAIDRVSLDRAASEVANLLGEGNGHA